MNKDLTVSIVGNGYVGLTTAAVLSNVGYKVYTVDIDKSKIETIKSGKSYFFETGLDNFVKKGINSGNLIPTLSYKEAIPKSDVIFSCVGTPDKDDGSSNLEFIFAAAKESAKYAKDGLIYVQKSTVPVGTGRNVIEAIQEENPNLRFSYVSNPEFLSEGSALFDTLNMDRIVVGSDDKESVEIVVKIFRNANKFAQDIDLDRYKDYAGFYSSKETKSSKTDFEDRIVRTGLESAELVKVSANAFLALKISFANSIAKLADKVGADITEVMNGVGADHRIGRSFLYAGLGWGGGCFPKDVSGLIAIAKEHGLDMPIMTSAIDENSSMINFVTSKVKKHTTPNKNNTVAILGLSFKPGTSDIRRSQSIKLANKLVSMGYSVQACDPKARKEAKKTLDDRVIVFKSLEECVKGVSVVVLATEWKEFLRLDWKVVKDLMEGNVLVDGRNRLDKEKLENMGFRYEGVGR